jgi:hypothetical protein
MKDTDEFYVGYSTKIGPRTKSRVKYFIVCCFVFLVLAVTAFSLSQKPFSNSTFELYSETKIKGIYHEDPYPMLRVPIADGKYKNLILLGFGKSSINPFLKRIKESNSNLDGKELSVEGNLIYYNGKTLIQLTDNEKVSISNPLISRKQPEKKEIGRESFIGEIVDPKCYFGVMKPGFGKIHRSCAVRCISGGIPPVLATKDKYGNSKYIILTNLSGEPINSEILGYIGKPAKITGILEELEDWLFLRISTGDIEFLDKKSIIYIN